MFVCFGAFNNLAISFCLHFFIFTNGIQHSEPALTRFLVNSMRFFLHALTGSLLDYDSTHLIICCLFKCYIYISFYYKKGNVVFKRYATVIMLAENSTHTICIDVSDKKCYCTFVVSLISMLFREHHLVNPAALAFVCHFTNTESKLLEYLNSCIYK